MQANAGLQSHPTFIRYRSQQEALKFLDNALADQRGVALLRGPSRSGKSVTINQFVRQSQRSMAIAVVDGARLKTAELLSRMLEQFGYNVVLNSVDEMLNLLTVFAVQQTRTHQAPVLILESVNDMFPSGLAALCKLASLKVNQRFALRIILVADRSTDRIIRSPSMKPIADRLIGDFELGPMSAQEAVRFIYAKLRAADIDRPDDVFSVEVCEQLHAMAGGLPGDLEEVAIRILQQTQQFPVRLEDIRSPADEAVPKLILTTDGKTVQEIPLTEKRALVGRSELSDIVIADPFVSKQHLLLIRDSNAIVLVDLKSRNGSFVNGKRVASKVLLHNDIVMVGDHRMKMIYPPGHIAAVINDPYLADTARMKNIADARRAREQKIPTLVPLVDSKKQQ